jgi:RHS repeat-associated protein
MAARLTGWIAGLVLVLQASAGLGQDVVQYYHLDAVGNVLAVTDTNGAVVEQHDYLPFGEEWCGTQVCGSVTPGQPKRFTGKERDAETGLDYFGARYYGSRIGRFTTVDPVRTMQALFDPQQWNRYAYARNNPLRYLDPLGLYVFDPSATDKQKDSFRGALGVAGGARDSLSGSQRDAVGGALSAYGAEGEANGVTVGFGQLQKGEAGTTTGKGLNPNTLLGDISVVFDLKQASGNDLAIAVAHEGSHTADYRAFYAALVADPAAFTGRSSVVGGALDLTKYATETRAYNVSAFTALGLGFNGLSVGGQQILNRGRVDSAAIGRMLGGSALYKLTPANPGSRLSGQ